ncbi:MAG TPA: hypothetical protein DEV93_10135 [Chloroflexi bacterium]|jgi:hypothetical protein|nr:hypothetical protein [Chloroflexota bacterium]
MSQVSETEFELDADYIRHEIDIEARRRLGISGDELLARFESGELDDPGRVGDLLALADLLREHVAA